MKSTDEYRIRPGDKVRLRDFPTRTDGGVSEEVGRAEFGAIKERLEELQDRLFAQDKHALLVVLQAMDTGGKDSTIRQVFTGFNPAGCRVVSFKAPNEIERMHDFLWRVHQNVPRRGHINVFNRSHYEDVVVVRVKGLAPKMQWKKRYEHINAFEKLLHDEGTTIVKFYLHISKKYQKERLLLRLRNPEKRWKFDPKDLETRKDWHKYLEAYEEAVARCSTRIAPWYVIPGEVRWYRNLLIARILERTLIAMKLKYPKPAFNPKSIVIN